jgi:acetyl esterase
VPLPSLSRLDGMNGGGGKIIAANGVAVVVVHFRDSVAVSSLPEVALFRAGLNDCISGLRSVVANTGHRNIHPARITVAGESGGN